MLTKFLKILGWFLLICFVLLTGAWLCWLEYRRPATFPDFPW